VIVDLAGKGGKLRVAPMAAAIKASIDRWTRAAGISEGRVFRRLRKGDRVLDVGLDDQSVADVLQHATRPLAAAAADPAEAALWRGLAPHDCRRTYAKLTRKAEAPLEQIQLTLGHQSRMTTQKYLGTEVDYHDAPSDRLGLRLPGHDLSLELGAQQRRSAHPPAARPQPRIRDRYEAITKETFPSLSTVRTAEAVTRTTRTISGLGDGRQTRHLADARPT
jgi:hypothetical protein